MRRTRVAAFVALGVLSLLAGAPAHAQDADQARVDELGLTVSVGYDGRAGAGSWQPVTVGIEPARPVAGTLAVSSSGFTGAEVAEIEVAAGSRKLYRFLLPSGTVRVALTEDGAEPLSVRSPNAGGGGGEFLVGLLGSGAANLPPLRSDITGQAGAWVTLDPAWLELSTFSTAPLGTVVANRSDLDALAPEGRANLAAAVASGLDLVVAGADERDLPDLGLPWRAPQDAWQLRADEAPDGVARTGEVLATAVPAGYGRVLVTPVQPGEPLAGRSGDLWSLLTTPAMRGTADPSGGMGGESVVTRAPHQFSRLLAEDGGDVPALPGLGLFVLVYVLVVGPVNGLVLARMGRRELAWATIPLVTVIFTGGAFVGATSARPPSGGAARLTYWQDGPATELLAGGLRAPTPGEQSLTLSGSEWTVQPLVDGARKTTVARGADTTVTMSLTALQLGGVAAWRTVDQPPPLEVTGTATSDGVDVEVRNTSGRALEDVVVRTATTTRGIDALAAGDTATVSLGSQTLPEAGAYRDPFEQLPLDNNGSVTPPLSLRAVVDSEVADGRPGMVWVSAVDTGAPPPPAQVDGEPVRDRGSMVAVGARITNARGPVSPFAVFRAATATGGGGLGRIGPEAFEGSGTVFLRYLLPPGGDPATLRDQLHRSNQADGGVVDITVWDRRARRWLEPEEAFGGDDMVGPLGEVWVRATGDMYPFEFSARTIAGGGP